MTCSVSIFGGRTVPYANGVVCSLLHHTTPNTKHRSDCPYIAHSARWTCAKCSNQFCGVCHRGFDDTAHQQNSTDEPCEGIHRAMHATQRYTVSCPTRTVPGWMPSRDQVTKNIQFKIMIQQINTLRSRPVTATDSKRWHWSVIKPVSIHKPRALTTKATQPKRINKVPYTKSKKNNKKNGTNPRPIRSRKRT